MKTPKEEKEIIDQIIVEAAKDANISIEQSRTNLVSALKQIQRYTLQKGSMDLSSIGTEVQSRSWNSRERKHYLT